MTQVVERRLHQRPVLAEEPQGNVADGAGLGEFGEFLFGEFLFGEDIAASGEHAGWPDRVDADDRHRHLAEEVHVSAPRRTPE